MNEYNRQRVRAARWIEENRNNPTWWTHGVLTAKNHAPNSLNLSEQIAIQIWTDWVSNGFFIVAPQQYQRVGQTAYFFNPAKQKEWHDTMYPPNWIVLAWRWSLKNLLYPLIIASITAIITIGLTNKYSSDSLKPQIDKLSKIVSEDSSRILNISKDVGNLKNEIVLIKNNIAKNDSTKN